MGPMLDLVMWMETGGSDNYLKETVVPRGGQIYMDETVVPGGNHSNLKETIVTQRKLEYSVGGISLQCRSR